MFIRISNDEMVNSNFINKIYIERNEKQSNKWGEFFGNIVIDLESGRQIMIPDEGTWRKDALIEKLDEITKMMIANGQCRFENEY